MDSPLILLLSSLKMNSEGDGVIWMEVWMLDFSESLHGMPKVSQDVDSSSELLKMGDSVVLVELVE